MKRPWPSRISFPPDGPWPGSTCSTPSFSAAAVTIGQFPILPSADEVILHLDDDVVAVAQVHQIAFPEPHAGEDLLHRFRLRLTGCGQENRGTDRCECDEEDDALFHADDGSTVLIVTLLQGGQVK